MEGLEPLHYKITCGDPVVRGGFMKHILYSIKVNIYFSGKINSKREIATLERLIQQEGIVNLLN